MQCQLLIKAQSFGDHPHLHHQEMIISLLVEVFMISETFGFCLKPTRLVDREDFVVFSRREIF
jgi:hypothetical protein